MTKQSGGPLPSQRFYGGMRPHFLKWCVSITFFSFNTFYRKVTVTLRLQWSYQRSQLLHKSSVKMGTRPSTSKSQPRLLGTLLSASQQRYKPQNALGLLLSDKSGEEGELAKRSQPNNPEPGSEMTRENRGTPSFKRLSHLTNSLQDGQVWDFFWML